jgi:hypothetical protein
MNKSFKKINYNLRPAKSVERKMISFALKKLIHFDILSNYQYVGFGSTYFSDFILFHKELGINKMVSIEISGNKQRFNFNKPFHCIEILFGHSNEMLPSINWKHKTILWLDYDETFKGAFLSDLSTFFNSAHSGSAFLLTVNCNADSYGNKNEDRRNKIVKEIGEDNLYHGSKLVDFSTINLPKTIHKIINANIETELKNRNGGLIDDEKLVYRQVFNFTYADGLKMMTVGGVLIQKRDLKKLETINFDEYNYLSSSEQSFDISVPKLTLKEIRFLNSLLPNGVDEDGNFKDSSVCALANPNLAPGEIKKYSKIYSFFPNYTEAVNL